MKKEIILIAKKVENSDTGQVTSLHYEAMGGEIITMVPAESVTALKIKPKELLCKISEFKTKGGTFRPGWVFKGDREPVQPSNELHIDLIDMAEQGAAEENLKKRIKAGETITTGDNNVAMGADIPEIAEDVWDGALLKGGRAKKTAPWNFI
ncbi:MAG: hypothetical protein CL489_06745, partial [Acidobacteria bacterium]|nr:hypothetical protein [Acidobacteriota bacterium]